VEEAASFFHRRRPKPSQQSRNYNNFDADCWPEAAIVPTQRSALKQAQLLLMDGPALGRPVAAHGQMEGQEQMMETLAQKMTEMPEMAPKVQAAGLASTIGQILILNISVY
jgi:hypothetical protein